MAVRAPSFRSSLNPNAPYFFPASFSAAEDFSPEWWHLVQTCPAFREYWLTERFDPEMLLAPDALPFNEADLFPDLDFEDADLEENLPPLSGLDSKEFTEKTHTHTQAHSSRICFSLSKDTYKQVISYEAGLDSKEFTEKAHTLTQDHSFKTCFSFFTDTNKQVFSYEAGLDSKEFTEKTGLKEVNGCAKPNKHVFNPLPCQAKPLKVAHPQKPMLRKIQQPR